ncbi:hypothetical protein PAAG_00943 [Paracoccidioides lutzii Pb01]|uniref:YDG domain-containing protein n=1 Tax=Paracoccidioides lutzii (strain ATCC MYA-826 / Pb01) TaxID=502779 RepID=C1GQZ8_PARBA|nr:hypothetical protein PAAG_00943 [Paracoccidioides lutzii Pb01]EEH38022.2 hypothetical protein PAAG_00943 [Paracoccidioides lutzii Pb01]
MDSDRVKSESSEQPGITFSAPSFSQKLEARLEEIRKQRAANAKSSAVTSAADTSMKAEETATVVAVATDTNLEAEETATSAASLQENDKPAGQPAQIPKRKRPVDSLPCTCAISENCRRAARDGVSDCRLNSGTLGHPPKRQQKTRTPFLSSSTRFISTKEKARLQRSAEDVLKILTLFKKSATASEKERATLFKETRDRVHHLQFYDIEPAFPSVLQKFLDQDTGLPAIIKSSTVPWDIKLDCEAILNRWEHEDFDPDLLRGIITRQVSGPPASGAQSAGKTTKLLTSRSFDKMFKFKKNSLVVGKNDLHNGQWFPLQIIAVRDGAHGNMEGGISGRSGIGAVSIVLGSAGKGYPDVDEGDTILYCGTRGKDGVASSGTKLLIESFEKKIPIRVLRSCKLPKINPYRPTMGFRYDGLYDIHGMEVLDQPSMLHRFKLRRIPEQTPIRYQGDEKRPTKRELEEWKRVYNLTATWKVN